MKLVQMRKEDEARTIDSTTKLPTQGLKMYEKEK